MNCQRPHLPEEELHAYLDGQLSPAQRAEIAGHLLGCLICRAQEAEVRLLRDRVSGLLAVAAPPRTITIPMAGGTRRSGRVIKVGTAAAILLMIGGTASTVLMDGLTGGSGAGRSASMATAFVAPAVIARVGSGLVSTAEAMPEETSGSAGRRQNRHSTLASRTAVAPRVIPGRTPAAPPLRRPAGAVDPLVAVDFPEGSWKAMSMAGAREQSGGAVAHLAGVPVSVVRLRESDRGARPLSMVRQVMADGRAVWVIEGVVEEMDGIYRMLTASGLNLSTPRRGLPDYIGSSDAPSRTVRMVAVAAYLPADSLDALADRQLTVR